MYAKDEREKQIEEFRRIREKSGADLHVMPIFRSNQWAVRRGNAMRAIKRFDSVDEALDFARSLSKRSAAIGVKGGKGRTAAAQIYVHEKNGDFKIVPLVDRVSVNE